MSKNENKIPSSTRLLLRGSNGDFKFDKMKYVVVQCSDGKYAEVSKEHLGSCSFIIAPTHEDTIYSFKYPAPVLEHLMKWTSNYGKDGSAKSKMVRPCIYRDFLTVLTDQWDYIFFNYYLWDQANLKYYILTMNAAEEYNMKGLLDMMAVGLSCKIRSEDESTIIYQVMGVEKDTEITEEVLEGISDTYPWFKDAITLS